MANLNLIVLTGRMTADPELRSLDSGASVVNFSVAVQRGYKPAGADDYPVDFIDVVAWRKTAEFIANYFKKGSMITIVGSLETRKFQDKNGTNRTAYEVKADRVSLATAASVMRAVLLRHPRAALPPTFPM